MVLSHLIHVCIPHEEVFFNGSFWLFGTFLMYFSGLFRMQSHFQSEHRLKSYRSRPLCDYSFLCPAVAPTEWRSRSGYRWRRPPPLLPQQPQLQSPRPLPTQPLQTPSSCHPHPYLRLHYSQPMLPQPQWGQRTGCSQRFPKGWVDFQSLTADIVRFYPVWPGSMFFVFLLNCRVILNLCFFRVNFL